MEDLTKQIATLEAEMDAANFWLNKSVAQAKIKELQELKAQKAGVGQYDKGGAVMTIFAGAGGDDAEDFARILLEMYQKYVVRQGWVISLVHENKNDHGGYRNVTIQIEGRGVYGILKGESGVHRLVRLSPFNAKSLRHTSFALVEVIPKFERVDKINLPLEELRVEFTRSSGPGGQNVNKRETAVRIVHLPTNLSAQAEGERSQAQNKETALKILAGKLYKLEAEQRQAQIEGLYISKTAEIEWGHQIRSYVFHPYKLIKDHHTGVEERDIEKVLNGELDEFIAAHKDPIK
ncbi:MAG: PCRF domain-containing protein [bacterium]|nr:PCRF domain-containing protein [bacterium]